MIFLSGCSYTYIDPYSFYEEIDIASARYYQVQKGDSVYSISQKYGLTPQQIIDYNHLRSPYILHAGQAIKIPRLADIPHKDSTYIVKKGDSLVKIANRHNIAYQELLTLNNLSLNDTLHPGQELKLASSQNIAISSSMQERNPSRPVYSQAPRKKIGPPPSSSKKGFLWPVRGKIISPFGTLSNGKKNDGVNIAAPLNKNIVAAENGIIAYSGNELRGFGELVLIQHANGYITAYAHLNKRFVNRGDKVARGQAIGTVGQTGFVNRPQLHFEIRKGKTPKNPTIFLR